MGQDFGQGAEWSEERRLDWYQRDESSCTGGIHAWWPTSTTSTGLARPSGPRTPGPRATPRSTPTTRAGNVLSFLRFGADGTVLACVSNFSGDPHTRTAWACRTPGPGVR